MCVLRLIILGNDDSVQSTDESVVGITKGSSSISGSRITHRDGVVRNDGSGLLIADNGSRLRVGVGDGNWVRNVLDNRGDLGVSVALNGRPGKVSTKTIRLDDGAVVLGSTDQVRSRDDGSLSHGEESEENGQLEKSNYLKLVYLNLSLKTILLRIAC